MYMPPIFPRLIRYWYIPLIIFLLLILFWYLYSSAPSGDGRKVYGLTVPKGAGFSRVAEELEQAGIVRSSLQMRISGVIHGLDRKIKPGDYRLTDSMTPLAILEKMASGVSDACRFTLPEGYSIYQAAELLEKQGIFSKNDFLEACRDRTMLSEAGIEAVTAEGYLFPGTYQVGFQMDERGLVTEMLMEFKRRISSLERDISTSGLSVNQVVTLASIVEKEAVSAEEKPLIASVFRNRLKIGMPLQSDPTAIYGVKAFGGTVTKQDVMRNSPYNTYKISGLPPGAIGNPGLDSVKAVIKPAVTQYLYFVARKDGTHQFSRSLQEHNHGVTMFLKGGKNKQERKPSTRQVRKHK